MAISRDAGAEQIVGPDLPVERGLSLDLGNRPLRLTAWPTAHTDCDLTVYDERTGTLWTGDLLFRERLPALDGNLKGWLAAIDGLSRMRSRLVVPGHGSLTFDLADSLARERAYLSALYDGVQDELAQGQSMQRCHRQGCPGRARPMDAMERRASAQCGARIRGASVGVMCAVALL